MTQRLTACQLLVVILLSVVVRIGLDTSLETPYGWAIKGVVCYLAAKALVRDWQEMT